MIHHFRQFMAISRLTALETIRRPVFLLVATTGILGIALMPILITHTLGESAKMVRDSALALQFVCGVLLGGFAACATLTREIKRGTASTILCKPVSRELFFLAKYAGVAMVLILFSAATLMSTLMAVRMAAEAFILDWWAGAPLLVAPLFAYLFAGARNYLTGRPFCSGAFAALVGGIFLAFLAAGFLDPNGHRTPFGAYYSWNIAPAAVLITLAILALAGIAISLAARMDMVPTLALCSSVFLLGLMSDYVFGRHARDSIVAAVLYAIIPNWQHYWVTDALSGGGVIPWRYVAWVCCYTALFLGGVMGLGLFAFRNMEIKS